MTKTSAGSTSYDGDDFVAASRDALVAALYAAGPNEPTLVEEWQTQHLAAAVFLKENPHHVTERGYGSHAMSPGNDTLGKSSPLAFNARKIADGPEEATSRPRCCRVCPAVSPASPTQNLLLLCTPKIFVALKRGGHRKLTDAYVMPIEQPGSSVNTTRKTGYALIRNNRTDCGKAVRLRFVTARPEARFMPGRLIRLC